MTTASLYTWRGWITDEAIARVQDGHVSGNVVSRRCEECDCAHVVLERCQSTPQHRRHAAHLRPRDHTPPLLLAVDSPLRHHAVRGGHHQRPGGSNGGDFSGSEVCEDGRRRWRQSKRRNGKRRRADGIVQSPPDSQRRDFSARRVVNSRHGNVERRRWNCRKDASRRRSAASCRHQRTLRLYLFSLTGAVNGRIFVRFVVCKSGSFWRPTRSHLRRQTRDR